MSDLIEELESAYALLSDRRKESVEYGDIDAITEQYRALTNCELLQQVFLHRAERLMVSSGTMVLEKNVYGLVLVIRGHFETTAALGYLCNRIQAFIDGVIEFEVVIMDIAKMTMGGKHQIFKTLSSPYLEKFPDPINVLTSLEKADRFLEREAGVGKTGILQDSHAWLSEFSHPNFNSNSSGFRQLKESGRFEFRHEEKLQKQELSLLGYLDISAKLFLGLFDALNPLAQRAFASSNT